MVEKVLKINSKHLGTAAREYLASEVVPADGVCPLVGYTKVRNNSVHSYIIEVPSKEELAEYKGTCGSWYWEGKVIPDSIKDILDLAVQLECNLVDISEHNPKCEFLGIYF